MTAQEAQEALSKLETTGHSLTKNIVSKINMAIAAGGELDTYLSAKLKYELSKHEEQPDTEAEPDPAEKGEAEPNAEGEQNLAGKGEAEPNAEGEQDLAGKGEAEPNAEGEQDLAAAPKEQPNAEMPPADQPAKKKK